MTNRLHGDRPAALKELFERIGLLLEEWDEQAEPIADVGDNELTVAYHKARRGLVHVGNRAAYLRRRSGDGE